MNWRSRPTLPFKGDREDDSRARSDPFRRFAEAAETIRATTKRLEKSSLLGDYFASLSDDDLVRAARYFAGYSFPLYDQRTTKVGGASLFSAIVAATRADPAALRSRLVTLGDLGDLAFEALDLMPSPRRQAQLLTLHDIADALEELASMSGSRRKVDLVTDLLEAAAPLEAKYIVKLLSGDLRIGLKEGAVEDAIARMFEVDLAEVQWANMLTGDVGETALLACSNRLSRATVRLFHPFKFMLATAVAGPEEVARQMPAPFFVEDKFDGIRAQAHIAPATEDPNLMGVVVEGTRVALFSRTLDEITVSFPDLLDPLAATLTDIGVGTGLILDGEIVPVQGDRIMPFLELQKRLGRKTLSDELKASVPVSFVAYDVLFAGGEILINQPLTKRRAILDSLRLDNDRVRRSRLRSHEEVSVLDDEFDGSRVRGNEGLVVKDPRSRYKPGRRGRDWLKMKRALATLDVVVTAVEVGHGRRSHLLSDYTFAVRVSEDDSSLLNIGKAYSGLTDLELAELSNWFREHTIEEFDHGRLRIVEPRIVLEVTFDGIQRSTRHASGYALRFPRILRIRHDKSADQIDTLGAVRGLL